MHPNTELYEYYDHSIMSEVNRAFTPELIKELKSFFVERYVDNMSTKDLVAYVMDDLDRYYSKMEDKEFLDQATTVFSEIASIIESSDNAENNIYDIVDFMIGIMTKDQLNQVEDMLTNQYPED